MAENTRLPDDQQDNREDDMDFSVYSHLLSVAADEAVAEDTTAAPDATGYDAAASNVAANEQTIISQERTTSMDANAMTIPAGTAQTFITPRLAITPQAGAAQNAMITAQNAIPAQHAIPAPVTHMPASVAYWQQRFQTLTAASTRTFARAASAPPMPAPPIVASPRIARPPTVLPYFDETIQAQIDTLVARLPPPPPPFSTARRPWTQAEDDLLMFLSDHCKLSHRVIAEHFLGELGRSFFACETRASTIRKKRREG